MFIITRIPDDIKSYANKWAEKKRAALDLSARLVSSGLIKRGLNMAACAEQMIFRHCQDCGKISVHRASLCRDKLCPICSWRLARKRFAGMHDILSYIAKSDTVNKYCFYLMTLTVPNVPVYLLSATLSYMSDAWNRLRGRVSMSDTYVAGWARSVEITYNVFSASFHPHFHILLVAKTGNPSFWFPKITNDWIQCYKGFGSCSILGQDIRPVYSRDIISSDDNTAALLETFKYTQKSSDLLQMPGNALYEYATQIAGKRMISYGGIIKEVKQILAVKDLDSLEDGDDETPSCSYCGSREFHEILCSWCGVSYTPII